MPVAFLRKPTSISSYGLFEWELILTVGFLLQKNTRKNKHGVFVIFPGYFPIFREYFSL